MVSSSVAVRAGKWHAADPTKIRQYRLDDIHFCITRGDPGWELYRSFLAVLRESSLSAAARRLALTQPTLGRHVEALEEALGVALFTRSRGGLAPTAAAFDLLPHAEAMAAAAEALRRAASGQAGEERGTVRVTASEVMGAEVLPAVLARFGARHPKIAVELALNNRNEDLLRRDADIALRMSRPRQEALVARRVGEVGLGLYAHRRYLAAFGTPQTLEELRGHRIIGYDRDAPSWQSVGPAPIAVTREEFAFRTDNQLAQLAALRAGVGIGGCQHPLAARDPALVRVLPSLAFALEMWLAMHEDLRASRRVRLLFDHLAAELAGYAPRQGKGRRAPSR
jgi:DNA-binding transcriptional LysR family regulator